MGRRRNVHRMKRDSSFKKNRPTLFRESKSDNFKVDRPNKTSRRLTEEEFAELVDVNKIGMMATRDEKGDTTRTTILRPKPAPPSYWNIYNDKPSTRNDNTYIIVHRQKNADMWNLEVRNHSVASPSCDGHLNWDDDNSEKRGLCWAAILQCTLCKYTSKKYKLYEEVENTSRGRKRAKPNAGIQVGVARLGLASSGLQEILASINIIPPSRAGLQKSANTINPMLVKTNKQDMKSRISRIKTLNQKKGLPLDTPINIEADATYNNRLNSGGGKTPTQPGTQATYLAAENVTTSKDIVHVGTYSKLCTCKRNKSGILQHKQECCANLTSDAVIGNEGLYLTNAVQDINSQGISINFLTMDGDSNSNSTATNIMQSSNPNIEITPLRCTRHLTRALEREIKKSKFSTHMFPGKNKSDRDRAQARFANDIGDRSHAEFNAVFNQHRGNLSCMKSKCSHISDAIIECYQGNCTTCKRHSFVCKGPQHSWKRPYLDNRIYKSEFINPTDGDKILLKKCLDIRLGQNAIPKTQLNTNQNKCEGANRGLMKGNPKHLTFPRNFPGRVHACVHSMNNGPGTSLSKLCAAVGAPITPHSNVTTALEQMDLTKIRNKETKKGTKYKQHRAQLREEKYKHYDIAKAEACYSTGLADKNMECKRAPKNRQDCTAMEYNVRNRRTRLQTSTLLLDHNYPVSATPTNEHNYFKAQ